MGEASHKCCIRPTNTPLQVLASIPDRCLRIRFRDFRRLLTLLHWTISFSAMPPCTGKCSATASLIFEAISGETFDNNRPMKCREVEGLEDASFVGVSYINLERGMRVIAWLLFTTKVFTESSPCKKPKGFHYIIGCSSLKVFYNDETVSTTFDIAVWPLLNLKTKKHPYW